MSSQRFCSRPWVTDENLLFDQLFFNDEVNEPASPKKSLFSSQAARYQIPPPPNFSQLLVSQQTAINATQSKNASPRTSQSKTVVKVQPQKPIRRNPPSSNSDHIFENYNAENEKAFDVDDVDHGDYLFENESTSDPNGSSFQTPSQMTLTVPSSRGPHGTTQQLRPVTEIPERFRFIFGGFPYFNFVQSKVLDDVLYTDKPVVVCSPTGSGKTVIFELAIIRLLMNSVHERAQNFKIIYMAPMKALCSERYEDWSKKFNPVGLTCKELTGDSEMDDYFELQKANIIMTTPEKWDSMTRKWKDNRALVLAVRLFLIDEVHLLNDESRGPTMEAVISRMKTVKTAESRASRQKEIFGANMRFLAISATIPNTGDIGEWLGTANHPAASYCMDDSYRPVKLRKVVLGYSWTENTSNYRFDLSLNYKLSSIIQTYSEDKPTLVFCSTRKGAQQAGNILIKDSRFVLNSEHRQRLQRCANSLHDSKLRELVMCGVGYHHAGLDTSDRKAVESMFTRGELPVLFATSTLAMGVNLPAHLVIIKSTMQYVKGVFEEYSESQILQMTGRAGRPQFDNSATAVIMTKNTNKKKYEAVIGGTQNVESCLHKNLIEHLNAEIVLNTITDVSIALEWLKSTFLYIRILKNPTYYGIPEDLDMEVLEKKLQEMCVESLNTLGDHGLVHMDEGFDLRPSDTGKLMARYCIAFQSMKLFLNLEGTEELSELITIVCQCKEFSDLKIRNNEKKVLNTLNKDKNRITIRFPINGKIKTTEQKINCLIQATLGCLPINEFALNQDVTKIFRSGQRVTKCLYEYCMLQTNYDLLMNALQLSKCFRARLWENSKYISKQLEKVGLTMSTMLVNAGLIKFNKIEETNPREIELIVNRHPPFGNQIREAVSCLPKYELDIEQKPTYSATRAELVVSVTMTNYVKRRDNSTKATGYHCCVLLIGDVENKIIHKQRLADAVFFSNGTWSRKIEVQRASQTSELKINVISQDIVGLDVHKTFTSYYTGPNRNFVHGTQSVSRKPPPKTATKETTKKNQPETRARQPCNHRCTNKHLCAHECCKNGVVVRKTTELKETYVNQPQTRTPKKDNTTRSINNSNMDSFVDQLHARNQAIPAAAGRKRLTNPFDRNIEFEPPKQRPHVELASFGYKPKPRINHHDVMEQVENVWQDLEENDWQDMEFYQDDNNKEDIELIDLCDDILDDDTEQDDWDFQYSYLDDKPSKTPTRQCMNDNPAYHPTSGIHSLQTGPTVIQKRSLDHTSCMSPEIQRTEKRKDLSRMENDLPERLTHQPSFSFPDKPRPIRNQFQRNTSTMLSSTTNQLKGNDFATASHIAATTRNQNQPSAIKLHDDQSWSHEKDGRVSSAMENQGKKGTRQERMGVGKSYNGTGEPKLLARQTTGNRDTSFQRPTVSNIMKKQGIQSTEQWRQMQVADKISSGSKAEVTIGQAKAKEISGSINSTVPTSFFKSANSCQGFFTHFSCQSDEDDDENQDAFKNIFTDVF